MIHPNPQVEAAAREAAAYGDPSVSNGYLRSMAQRLGVDLNPEQANQLLEAARTPGGNRGDLPPALEYDALTGESAERLLQRKLEPVDAVPTFLPTWSACCRDEGAGVGIARGWMVTMAAGSGKGKSISGGNQAVKAVQSGELVGIHSAEMAQSQLFTRTLAMGSGEPVRLLEQGKGLQPDVHRRAARAFDEMFERTGGRLHANRRPIHDLRTLEAAVRRTHDALGCRFHIVDYLQLLAVDPNDPAAVTQVAHRTRQLAQDLNVAVLALSQFNRSTSANPARPTIHGLMGSSAIENDSDQVLLIDHSQLERAQDAFLGVLLLAKNRHGPAADIPYHFDTRTLRIRERMPDELPARDA